MRKYTAGVAILVLSVAIFLYMNMRKEGGSKTDTTTQKHTQVVTTLYPFEEVAKRIGGEYVNVSNIIPAGIEPHDYEPSPQDRVAIQMADIFLYNGIESIEPWITRVAPSLTNTKINASESVALIGRDPHFWLDTSALAAVGEKMAAELTEKDPKHANDYQKNLSDFVQQLKSMDAEYKTKLTTCGMRDVIVSHDAFRYLGARYHFNTHAIAGLSPENEPEPGTISDIIRLVRDKKINYILFETLASPKIADTIAEETGAQTLVLNPLEGLARQDVENKENLFTLMRKNLSVLATAMNCAS
jgi:zinc transport system substrate-binding protein